MSVYFAHKKAYNFHFFYLNKLESISCILLTRVKTTRRNEHLNIRVNFRFKLEFEIMGNQQPNGKKDEKDKEKKKYEAPIPTRVGKKKRVKGPDMANKLPEVKPYTKCRLRLLKMERIKDYLLMEEEYIKNQERMKPQDEKNEEERSQGRYRNKALVFNNFQSKPSAAAQWQLAA